MDLFNVHSMDLTELDQSAEPGVPAPNSTTILVAAPGPVLLLGAPGVGKGTQAHILASFWGVPTFSTGEILRANVAGQTVLGVEAEMIMRRGALVPDEVLTEMMAERLCGSDTARGYILDGFPRTIQQALWLDEHLAVHR
jgi:adenylate kinase